MQGRGLGRLDRSQVRRRLRRLLTPGPSAGPTDGIPDLSHLAAFTEKMGGPVQREEALLLHGLVRVVRPRTVVEVGFFHGHSAANFLRALDPDGRLYSFDVDPSCEGIAHERFGDDPRFTFRVRSQTELARDDIDGHLADFVFLNWLLDAHPEFSQLHLHSRRTSRCGFTVLQRSVRLPRPPKE